MTDTVLKIALFTIFPRFYRGGITYKENIPYKEKGFKGFLHQAKTYKLTRIERYSSLLIPKMRRLFKIINTGMSFMAGITIGRFRLAFL